MHCSQVIQDMPEWKDIHEIGESQTEGSKQSSKEKTPLSASDNDVIPLDDLERRIEQLELKCYRASEEKKRKIIELNITSDIDTDYGTTESEHEIVGDVTEIGSEVEKVKVGDKVGVGCMVGASHSCDNSMVANEPRCSIPDGMPLDSVAPLLCAGITIYSPLKYFELGEPGKHIGIVGLGHVAVN
ncbi:hypothetical protein Golax_023113 [Gossypium laxum]|uniref:Alcohol dehydrogenase-like N-terminal domain-containing protein n=1 Tax=Gossypium laxum TaxID=34288 RepID=A0A7J9B2R0_9ROSI|nr:hypothetical protein [Gossypium laxum]